MDRKLDHLVDEAGPLVGRKAVAVEEEQKMSGTVVGAAEPVPFGDVIIVELSVQPRGMSEIPHGIDRSCELPINEGDR
ncbi:MAG TPA: hypothetical protein VID75_05300 [Acidimicrobiales bacterium]